MPRYLDTLSIDGYSNILLSFCKLQLSLKKTLRVCVRESTVQVLSIYNSAHTHKKLNKKKMKKNTDSLSVYHVMNDDYDDGFLSIVVWFYTSILYKFKLFKKSAGGLDFKSTHFPKKIIEN